MTTQTNKQELNELQQEEQQIINRINDIMFINNFNTKEKDELLTLINLYADNQIQQQELCNQ